MSIPPQTTPSLARKDPGPFKKTDTDLGRNPGGNFDVRYRPQAAELLIVLKVKYNFDDGISAAQQANFKLNMQKAIDMWNQSGVSLQTWNVDALNEFIDFRFVLIQINTRGEHKVINVDKDPSNEGSVIMDVNVPVTTITGDHVRLLAHELGHVFGRDDEYPLQPKGVFGTLEWFFRQKLGFLHEDRYLHQTNALMHHGKVFYPRYFDHFQEFVNEHFAHLGVRYELVTEPRVSNRPQPAGELGWGEPLAGLIGGGGYIPARGGLKRRPGPLGAGPLPIPRKYA